MLTAIKLKHILTQPFQPKFELYQQPAFLPQPKMEGSNPFIFIAISHSTPHTTPTQNLIIFTLRSHIHYKCVSLKYILHHNHHLLLALLASSAGIELISLSVRVTSAKFQQSVGGTETGTHTPYISVICFYFSSRKFLFLLSKNMNF